MMRIGSGAHLKYTISFSALRPTRDCRLRGIYDVRTNWAKNYLNGQTNKQKKKRKETKNIKKVEKEKKTRNRKKRNNKKGNERKGN